MPEIDVKSAAVEYRRLASMLADTRKDYENRRFSWLNDFLAYEQSEESLIASQNQFLKKTDLLRKINYIEKKLNDISKSIYNVAAVTAATIAPDFAAIMNDAHLRSEAERQRIEMHNIGNVLRGHRREQDKQDFLTEIREINAWEKPYSLLEQQEIFDFANKAIILFNEDQFTDLESQFTCWQIVKKALTIKSVKFQDSKNINELADLGKYRLAAKTMFTALIKKLPVDMQPLKVLYSMGEYNWVLFLVDRYLEHADDPDALAVLTRDIHKICDIKCRAKARKQFDNMVANYADLPKQHRDALEEQRAYVIMLRSYSYFADQNPESQELREKIRQDSNLLDQNLKNVLAQQTEIGYASQEYIRIKQELAKIDSDKRWDDLKRKTIDATTAVYTYPMSGSSSQNTESALSNVGKTVVFGSLAALGYYVGIDTISSAALTLATTTAAGAAAVPVAALVKADIETKREKFPKLDQKRAFLERTDLNQVDKIFLANMDQYMEYDPVERDFINPNAKLLVENDNLFKDMYKKFLADAEKYVKARTEEIKELANDAFLREILTTRTLIEEVLSAAGKTLAGLILMTGVTLLTFLLAVGLTGPIVLFAMSPALSVGLVGAAVVAGLKYMYPDHKTTIGFLVDATVKAIFAPVELLVSGAEILSRPFMAFYRAYKEKRTKQVIATAAAAATFGLGFGIGMPILAANIFAAPVIGIIGTAIGSLAAGTYLALTAAAVSEYIYNKILSNPKIQARKLERTLAVMNLTDNQLSGDYAAVNAIMPELLPTLTRLFKSEVGIIKEKIDAAITSESNIDLAQVAKDLAQLELWWEIFKSMGNKPQSFAINLEGFLAERYKIVRDSYESVGKERAKTEAKPYVEPVRQVLSFSKRPSFAMDNVSEYRKDQQSLRDVQSLKHQERLIKLIKPQ